MAARANMEFLMPETEIHGDLFFKLMHNDKGIVRFAINTSMFLPFTGAKNYYQHFDTYTIDPYQIVKDKEYSYIKVICHFVPACKDVKCQSVLTDHTCKNCKKSITAAELNQWETIRKIVQARYNRAPDLMTGFI